jgi:ABC-type uncharacterized transport system permease subunit
MIGYQLHATAIDILATLVLLALICICWPSPCDVDSVLTGCAVGSVFALTASVFRFTPYNMHGLAVSARA